MTLRIRLLLYLLIPSILSSTIRAYKRAVINCRNNQPYSSMVAAAHHSVQTQSLNMFQAVTWGLLSSTQKYLFHPFYYQTILCSQLVHPWSLCFHS
ncbi:hypothetical protein E1A91_D06G034500v1 [Gossypium mustelinum]|uniref:Secreted protein n=1 Tax=Gossypium mustelinum TaxID=34275 RepID=A0A5D2UGF3_GOSMU|nr:hypothetical protein E1A91_D06G034500v1 [Gossypium mustelinum]